MRRAFLKGFWKKVSLFFKETWKRGLFFHTVVYECEAPTAAPEGRRSENRTSTFTAAEGRDGKNRGPL